MRIGVDIGGTKLEAVALDPSGRSLDRVRIVTPRDYDQTLTALRDLVLGMEQRLQQTGTVGVGMPGTISPQTGLVKNANALWLNGRPLQTDLSRELDREVRCTNDANCLAASEAVDGAAAGAAVVFAAIVGVPAGDDFPCQGLGDALDDCLDHEDMQYVRGYFTTADGQDYTHFVPACERVVNTEVVTSARPGRRYVKVAQEFGCTGYVYSICNDDWSPAMQEIARLITKCFVPEVPTGGSS